MKTILASIGIFLVIAILVMFGLVVQSARSFAKSTRCLSNLSQIGKDTMLYKMDHHEEWPISLRQLTNCCKNPAVFVCPLTRHKPGPLELVDQWSDYILVTNLSANASNDQILAYCKPENHNGQAYHVDADGDTMIYGHDQSNNLSCNIKAHSRRNEGYPRPIADKGPEKDAENDIGRTPLMKAVATGNIEQVTERLNEDVDVDEKDKYGWTPLFLAACNGNNEIAKLLIDRGANVNTKNYQGDTPLMKAVLYNPEIVKVLIEKGADMNARNKEGKTPLSIAVNRGREEVAEFLKQHGAKE